MHSVEKNIPESSTSLNITLVVKYPGNRKSKLGEAGEGREKKEHKPFQRHPNEAMFDST